MARALTKRHGTGKLYARPPESESRIDAALAQDLATLRRRAQTTDRASSDYLESECLVHLIREARRRHDDPQMDTLFPVLLRRCEINLLAQIPASKSFDVADVREEILGRFAELFATDGSGDNPDQLDYFECRFNAAFRTLRIDVLRAESARLSHISALPSISDDEDTDAGNDAWAVVSKAFRTDCAQESSIFRNQLHAAINALPTKERQAVVLCHLLGYKIESENPDEQTAATRCGVSGRTIRSRLSGAAAKLAQFKTEA